MAAATSQETNESADRAGGVLSMEPLASIKRKEISPYELRVPALSG